MGIIFYRKIIRHKNRTCFLVRLSRDYNIKNSLKLTDMMHNSEIVVYNVVICKKYKQI